MAANPWIDAINQALIEAGEAPIVSGQDIETARIVEAVRPGIRDAVLRGHPWNFSEELLSLPASGIAPEWKYQRAYPFLTDPFMLRINFVDTFCPWVVGRHESARAILTDEAAPLKIAAGVRVDDPTLWDDLALQGMALRVAATVAFRFADSRSLATTLWDRSKEVLVEAKNVDGQEASPEEPEDSSFLDARG